MAGAYQQQGCSSAMFKHLITKRQPVGVTSIITIAAGVREYSGAADGVGIVVTAAEVGGDFTGQLTVGSVSVCHCWSWEPSSSSGPRGYESYFEAAAAIIIDVRRA